MREQYRHTDSQSIHMPIIAIATMLAMPKPPSFADALAENVRQLMAHEGLTQLTLAKKSGVGQATLSGLLSDDPGAPKRNPRADTIDKLADYFGIPAWALCIPEVPLDLLLGGEAQSVLTNLVAAPRQGRDTILRIAEAEARYAAISGDSGCSRHKTPAP